MRRILWALVLLLVVFGGVPRARAAPEGYSIDGIVLEKGTRRVLPYVNVFLQDNSAGATVTNEEGRFSLIVAAPGEFVLSAVAVGYDKPPPRRVSVAESLPKADITIYLEPALQLPDIVVYGERSPDKVSKISIGGKELAQVAGSAGDPMHGLKTLPGVSTTSDAAAAPAIRGTAPDDNLYYVDGLPVGYLFHWGGVVSTLNADLVQDFNFYPSAFGPEFDNALGGVIDVRLRDPRRDRFGAKVNVNFYEGDFLIEGPVTEDQSYYLAARRSYFDLILPKTGSLDEHDDLEYRQFPVFSDYQGKYLWRTQGGDTLSLQIGGATDEMELFVPDDSRIAEQDPVLAGSTELQTRYDSQGVVWNRPLSPRSQQQLRFAHLTTRSENTIGTAGTAQVEFDTYQLREEVTTRLAAHRLLLGGSYTYTQVDYAVDARDPRCTEFDPDCDFTSAPRLQGADRLRAGEGSLYVKDRWRLARPFTLVLGARHSRETYLDEAFTEPRLGTEWQVTERTLLTAGWGRYHQFPQGGQVVDTFGNPNLSSLRGEHWVLGATRRFDDAWSWSTEFYYKTLEDLVVADDATRYSNGGSGEVRGVDILVKKDLTDRFSGWLALTLSRSERTNEATGETFRSNFDQPVIVNLVSNYRLSRYWKLGATWRYHSGSPYTPIEGSTLRPGSTDEYLPVYGETNSERFPAYHRLDLRLGRDFVFNTWKLNTYFELINAYNRRNVGGYRYSADYSEREPVYQLPLLFSFGVQAEF